MSFDPQSLGRPGGVSRGTGGVDYRLARNAVIAEYRRGRLSRSEVCDAHPELLRAARSLGSETSQDCPVCEGPKTVLVSYAFGAHLPPGGQCLSSSRELAKLSERRAETAFYVVEVCPGCSWNHLARSFWFAARNEG